MGTNELSDTTSTFSVKSNGLVYKQAYDFIYVVGDVNHNADLSIEINWCIVNAWCSFRKYTLEQYDRPSALLELKVRETLYSFVT